MLNKDKIIAIYGLSSATQKLLEQLNEYNVIGLLDGYHQEGMMYGKPIISIDKAIKNKVEVIIIVARPSSRRIIVNRICKVCKKHNIKVYDIYGKDLLDDVHENKISYVGSGIKREELLEKINKNEVISFDIFDTLLMRTVLYPSDVYELVEQKVIIKYGQSFDFYKKRQEIERNLSRTGVPTIYHIYKELEQQIPLSRKELKEIQELEWQVEQQVLLPRYDMCQILQYALEQHKRVYLISDMYYTEKQLIYILNKFGIVGYEKLIVSCEYGTTKELQLFQILKQLTKAEKYLHIGDNYLADVKGAEKYGITGIWIKSGLELFESVGWSVEFEEFHVLAERIKLGMFIARMFNSPFAISERNFDILTPEGLGYLILAPILTDFTIWIRDKIEEMEESTILFFARDGYLLKNLFDILLNNGFKSQVKSIYFLTSRISVVNASIFQMQDIVSVASIDFNGTFKKMLETRFLLTEEEIVKEDYDIVNSIERILRYENIILNRSKENREGYLKYIKNLEIPSSNVAVFDFVSSGTCQAGLEKIMKQKMRGYYFIQIEDDKKEKKKLDIISFYDKGERDKTKVYEDYFILENILTSPIPSLRKFDKEGNPEYMEEKRKKEEMDFINQVQDGIVQYFEQYIKLLPTSFCKETRECSERMFELLHKVAIKDEIFQQIMWEDNFYSRSVSIRELM